MECHGQPLLDLSLYISSQNYVAVTRPVYNKIQSFPLPYLTPPSIRAAAKLRTEHLGLSSLDIDTDDQNPSPEASIIPASLRRPKHTVSSMLAASPETSAQIRLNALTTDFFEPLQDLKGNKQFFVSDNQFSSLDCLALGYLALMMVDELPQPWLKRTMEQKFPGLYRWTEDLSGTVFGREKATLEDAFLVATSDSELDARLKRLRGRGNLPWKSPYNRSAFDVGKAFVSNLAESIPVVGQMSKNTRMKQHGGSGDEGQSSSWQYLGLIGSLIAGVGLGIGYMFQQGLILLPGEEPEKPETNDFGHLGDALGFYGSRADATPQRQTTVESTLHGQPVVEIEIAQDTVRSTETIS